MVKRAILLADESWYEATSSGRIKVYDFREKTWYSYFGSRLFHGGYENPTTREVALEDLEFLKDVLKKLFEWVENA